MAEKRTFYLFLNFVSMTDIVLDTMNIQVRNLLMLERHFLKYMRGHGNYVVCMQKCNQWAMNPVFVLFLLSFFSFCVFLVYVCLDPFLFCLVVSSQSLVRDLQIIYVLKSGYGNQTCSLLIACFPPQIQ